MKCLVGSVSLIDNGDSIRFMYSAHIESGVLDEKTFLASGKPQHDVWQVELPDGAIPFCTLPPLSEGDSDVLQWYKPLP